MANAAPSTKRLQIDKANATMVVAIAVASFLTIFSMVAIKSLWSQRSYQAKVITKKEKARDQLKTNLDTSKTLITSYQSFVGTSANVLGGNPTGTGDKDGDNAKIVLDALPSSYDFPALATSLEKLLTQNGLKITGITGTDDEKNQQTKSTSTSPQPVTMPFTVSVTGGYGSIQSLVGIFEQSIRPIQIQSLAFQGSDNALNMTVTAQTYYQPEISLKVGTETIK